MRIIWVVVLICVSAIPVFADDERIIIDAKINGQPVRFAFDTGAGPPFILFSPTARKLGLKVKPPPPGEKPNPGQITSSSTESCNLDLGITNFTTSLDVVDIPPHLLSGMDGIIGWTAIRNNIFSVDFSNHTFIFSTNVPGKLAAWFKFRINNNSDSLALVWPGKGIGKSIIALDSGCPFGVELNPQKWHEWKEIHTNQLMTLEGYYTPNPGFVVAEEGWANKISLETLTLTDVPVIQADSSDIALNSSSTEHFVATLGFAALKRLDVILDGKMELLICDLKTLRRCLMNTIASAQYLFRKICKAMISSHMLQPAAQLLKREYTIMTFCWKLAVWIAQNGAQNRMFCR